MSWKDNKVYTQTHTHLSDTDPQTPQLAHTNTDLSCVRFIFLMKKFEGHVLFGKCLTCLNAKILNVCPLVQIKLD